MDEEAQLISQIASQGRMKQSTEASSRNLSTLPNKGESLRKGGGGSWMQYIPSILFFCLIVGIFLVCVLDYK